MQEAMIVKENETGTRDLNRKLNNGWHVVMMCPMPSSCTVAAGANASYGKYENNFVPTCLVVLEK